MSICCVLRDFNSSVLNENLPACRAVIDINAARLHREKKAPITTAAWRGRERLVKVFGYLPLRCDTPFTHALRAPVLSLRRKNCQRNYCCSDRRAEHARPQTAIHGVLSIEQSESDIPARVRASPSRGLGQTSPAGSLETHASSRGGGDWISERHTETALWGHTPVELQSAFPPAALYPR